MSAEEEFLPIYDEDASEEYVHNEETTLENDEFVSVDEQAYDGGSDSISYTEDESLESREGKEDDIIDVEEEEEDATRGRKRFRSERFADQDEQEQEEQRPRSFPTRGNNNGLPQPPVSHKYPKIMPNVHVNPRFGLLPTPPVPRFPGRPHIRNATAGYRGPIILTPPLVSPVPQPRAISRGPMRAPITHHAVRPVQLRPQQPHIARTPLLRPYIPLVRPRPQTTYSTNLFPPRYPMATQYRPFMAASPNMTYSLRPPQPTATNLHDALYQPPPLSSTRLTRPNLAPPKPKPGPENALNTGQVVSSDSKNVISLKENQVQKTGNTITISGLSEKTTEEDLRKHLAEAGLIDKISISNDSAVVTFRMSDSAKIAKRKFHRSFLDGKCITIALNAT